MAAEREIPTYEMLGTSVRELAPQVVDAGYEPDPVLSIARGGRGPARPPLAGGAAAGGPVPRMRSPG